MTSSVSASIGISGFAGGAISGFAGGITGGFISGYGMATLPGGSGTPLKDGLQGALWGGLMGAGINGISQGISSWRNGGNFWDGSRPVLKPVTSVVSEIDNAPKSFDIEIESKPLPEGYTGRMVDDRMPFEKGQEGLRLNSIQQNTQRIESLTNTSRYRIPDEMIKIEKTIIQIGEVKHYSIGRTVTYTNQLKDFVQYANQKQVLFQLYVPNGVHLSKPLQNAINQSQYIKVVYY